MCVRLFRGGGGGVPCDQYPLCIAPHHVGTFPALKTWTLLYRDSPAPPPDVFSLVQLGLHCVGPPTYSHLFNLDLNVQDPPYVFSLVHFGACMIGKRAVRILSERFLLIMCELSGSDVYYHLPRNITTEVNGRYKQECIPVGCAPPARNRIGGLPRQRPPARQRPPSLDRDPPSLDRDSPTLWTDKHL